MMKRVNRPIGKEFPVEIDELTLRETVKQLLHLAAYHNKEIYRASRNIQNTLSAIDNPDILKVERLDKPLVLSVERKTISGALHGLTVVDELATKLYRKTQGLS